MAADDLTAPLGQNRPSKRRFVLPIGIPHLLAGAMGLPIVVFMAWAIMKNDPYGGEPIVIVTANQRAGAANPTDSAAQPGGTSVQADKTRPNRYDGPTAGEQPATAEPPPGSKTVNIIDGSSGKRQQVVVAGGPDDGKATPPDERLSEPSRHGPLPKVAQDGTRPADVFAQPVKAAPVQGEENLVPIKAPLLGIFYRRPQPGSPPYVEEGSLVEKSTTVALIEVMKLFTTLHAEWSGTVKEIGAENAALVEYGQMLFVIAPD